MSFRYLRNYGIILHHYNNYQLKTNIKPYQSRSSNFRLVKNFTEKIYRTHISSIQYKLNKIQDPYKCYIKKQQKYLRCDRFLVPLVKNQHAITVFTVDFRLVIILVVLRNKTTRSVSLTVSELALS